MTNKDIKKVLKILSADGGKAIIGYCDKVGNVSVFGTEASGEDIVSMLTALIFSQTKYISSDALIKELTRRVKIAENTKKVP